MREIKFRVWNTREKKYHMPFKNCSTTYNLDYYENTKHVEYPEQYTGLKDVNGKEIYEGDTVDGGYYGGKFTVMWVGTGFNLPLTYKWQDMGASGTETLEYEIIGNIHEEKGD